MARGSNAPPTSPTLRPPRVKVLDADAIPEEIAPASTITEAIRAIAAGSVPNPTEASTLVASASPESSCDLSITCPTCQILMQPEHAHYRCVVCGYRDSCCY
jgi:hypothetical protein